MPKNSEGFSHHIEDLSRQFIEHSAPWGIEVPSYEECCNALVLLELFQEDVPFEEVLKQYERVFPGGDKEELLQNVFNLKMELGRVNLIRLIKLK